MKNGYVITILFSLLLVISACGNSENQDLEKNSEEPPTVEETSQDEMSNGEMKDDHSIKEGHGHNMSSDGKVPDGLQPAESPVYKEGDQVIIEAEHAEGHDPMMKGAVATVTGAFDTTAYAVSFTPTTGGDPVTNHKWIIHEELKNAENAPFSEGTAVTLAADHMEGMDGAKATIDTAEQTTVYMVDFTTVDGEQDVTNHKWVTENELRAPE
ncbi:YdhK family protein [Halobacillus litoralis]|uniref:YdhK family protein n=1 Tax=Halobacillus litoralis TaxID=45668 RepID=UPI001CFE181F|nr:YdhK family protein [Halobacillus litoralis]WLR48013.1 YdhK family protein [Halobacillus litoralis]